MSASPHPQFFIVRPDGSKTPLIAVDELPPSFHILGVPRFISHAQAQGMVGLGIVPCSGYCYVVREDEDSPMSSSSLGPSTQSENDKQDSSLPKKYTAPDAGLGHTESPSPTQNVSDSSQDLGGSSTTSYGTDIASMTKQDHIKPPGSTTQAIIDAVTRASSETSKQQEQQTAERCALGTCQIGRGKKIYCNYWLRKGECDYIQQGCLYKHEMPLDKATLASLGLREVPRWYREQRASIATAARPQKETPINRPWRAPEATCLFPTVQPDAPRILSSASTTTGFGELRNQRFLQHTLPCPVPIVAQRDFKMSGQQQIHVANGSISPNAQNRSTGNVFTPRCSKQVSLAQPAQPCSNAPDTSNTPERATEQHQPAHWRLETRSRYHRDRYPSEVDLLAAIPTIMPSQAPLECATEAALRPVSTNTTLYPGVPRTASPAHPRLFVKQGQSKYATNKPVQSVEKFKTAVGNKADSQSGEKQSSMTLNIFGDLGV